MSDAPDTPVEVTTLKIAKINVLKNNQPEIVTFKVYEDGRVELDMGQDTWVFPVTTLQALVTALQA